MARTNKLLARVLEENQNQVVKESVSVEKGRRQDS
jgi:hypothetical protein